jgi:hypothetical protein
VSLLSPRSEAAAELAKAGNDYDAELAFGLDVILDGLERLGADGGAGG